MEDIISDFGINLLEEEIDDVIFQTNEFLTSQEFMSQGGPFYIILQISMALGAIFAFIMACQMGYKMLLKNEPLDVLKLFRPLAVAIIMCWWYPPSQTGLISNGLSWSVLDFLSFIPNAFGSYTHELYNREAEEISIKFKETQKLIYERDTLYLKMASDVEAAKKAGENSSLFQAVLDSYSVNELAEIEGDQSKLWFTSLTAGITIMIDKIVMSVALVVYRIGWWATIYCQQILLGMLTIFGPIQWAFSLLPKWEGVWAKWIIRYLTVHFYGAMLYFVVFRSRVTN